MAGFNDSYYLSGDNVFPFTDDELYDVTIKGSTPVGKVTSFEDPVLDMHPTLLKNLAKKVFEKPSPIQGWALPIINAKVDALFTSFTGTGKTASYLIAVINLIKHGFAKGHDWHSPKVLIMAPTRELAEQIHKEAQTMTKGLSVSSMAIVGGDADIHWREIKGFKKGQHSDILVATPGRLQELLTNVDAINLELQDTRILIIDGVDDMGSLEILTQIGEITKGYMKKKEERMTFMFSATFPIQVQLFAKKHLRKHFVHIIIGIIGTASPTPNVMQEVLAVSQVEKAMQLKKILDENPVKKILVFCNTNERVENVVRTLNSQGFHPLTMHSGFEQAVRDRSIRNFQSGKDKLMVATSIAARGLNIKDCAIVINYDVPPKLEEYVQRIKRVRNFQDPDPGVAISFYDENQDHEMANSLKLALTSAQQSIPQFLEEVEADSEESQMETDDPDVESMNMRLRKMRFSKKVRFADPENF